MESNEIRDKSLHSLVTNITYIPPNLKTAFSKKYAILDFSCQDNFSSLYSDLTDLCGSKQRYVLLLLMGIH